jgi:hypothetical protein
VHGDRSQWGHGREHETFAPDARRKMQNHGLSSEFDEARAMGQEALGRTIKKWVETRRWRSQITRYFTPLERQGAVHAAPTRQQQYRRLCLRMRERLASARVADGEAWRAAARKRARQQHVGATSTSDPNAQDNAVAEPQSATQCRRVDATGSDSEEREQGGVPVCGRRGLRQ